MLLYSVCTVKPSIQTQHAHLKCLSDMKHSLGALIHIKTRGFVCVHARLMHRRRQTKIIMCDPLCELALMWEITLAPCGTMWL